MKGVVWMGNIIFSFGVILVQGKLRTTSCYMSDEKILVLYYHHCSAVTIEENVNSVRVGIKAFEKWAIKCQHGTEVDVHAF